MKKIFAILLLFVTIFGFSQDKKVTGFLTMRKTDDPYNESRLNIKKYSIFLLKDLTPNSKFKKVFESKKEKFKISIRKKDLIEYNYLMFVSTEGNITYEIKMIPKDKDFIAKIEDNLVYFYSM